MTIRINLSNVRLSFPDLFVAREFERGDGKGRYNATFLIEPGSKNDKVIRAAIAGEAADVWKTKAAGLLQQWEHNPTKMCYQNGDNKAYDGYAGHMYLSSHNKVRPRVVDRDGQTPLAEQDGRPYAGCYVNAIVEIWGQNNEYTGIRCKLIGVQFVRDGDSFGGGLKLADDAFEDLGVEVEDSLVG